MKVTWEHTCSSCSAPLDVIVRCADVKELQEYNTWLMICDLDMKFNYTWYRILGPNMVVRMCAGCWVKSKAAKCHRCLMLREIGASMCVHKNKIRPVSQDQLLRWFERLEAYFKRPEALRYKFEIQKKLLFYM